MTVLGPRLRVSISRFSGLPLRAVILSHAKQALLFQMRGHYHCTMQDQQLIQTYIEHGSESAFRTPGSREKCAYFSIFQPAVDAGRSRRRSR